MGKVFLIGAGPGDPQLLTLKALRTLAAADVILIDELVHRDCLSHARRDVQVVEVGKRGGCKSTPQAFIEKLLHPLRTAGKDRGRGSRAAIRSSLAAAARKSRLCSRPASRSR